MSPNTMSKLTATTASKNLKCLESSTILDNVVYVTGLPCIGKTTLIEEFFKTHEEYIHVTIQCNLIARPSALYIYILKQLIERIELAYQIPNQLLSAPDFVEHYEDIHESALKRGLKKIYLVFDRLEYLKKTSLFDSITMFSTIPQINLIMVSCEAPFAILESIKSDAVRKSVKDRLKIVNVEPWNKKEVVSWILEEPPRKHITLYSIFVNNVVAVVYNYMTKNYVEVRAYCQENFDKFLMTFRDKTKDLLVKQHEIDSDEEVTDDILEGFEIQNGIISNIVSTFVRHFKDTTLRQGIDIRNEELKQVDNRVGVGMGCLIVAVYIAAYTRHSDDKRNFVKFQKRSNRGLRPNSGEIMAKPCTLERILQIYRALSNLSRGISDYDECVSKEIPDSVLGDLEILEYLGMLKIHAGDGIDAFTRYKISPLVTRDYVSMLAKNDLDLDLNSLHGLD